VPLRALDIQSAQAQYCSFRDIVPIRRAFRPEDDWPQAVQRRNSFRRPAGALGL